jgi:diacylglycerol kinase family enzyme
MRALVLHNPSAGSGDISAEDLLAALAAGGTAARYCSIKALHSSDALGDSSDFVVVAGGDGTVVKAVDYVRNRKLPIAIVPLGSANNIARSLGIEADPHRHRSRGLAADRSPSARHRHDRRALGEVAVRRGCRDGRARRNAGGRR